MRSIWASELGASIYVFWGGREGAEVDAAKDPRGSHQVFSRGARTFCANTCDRPAIRPEFALEAKPNEPRGDMLLPDDCRAISRFIATLDYPDMVGVNPEVAHEHMAGLNFFHVVAQAIEGGKLFHIDLNDQKPGRVRSGPPFRVRVDQAALLPRQAA